MRAHFCSNVSFVFVVEFVADGEASKLFVCGVVIIRLPFGII